MALEDLFRLCERSEFGLAKLKIMYDGKKLPKYKAPTATVRDNYGEFLTALHDFDHDPSIDNLDRIEHYIGLLNLTAVIPRDDTNAIFFFPNDRQKVGANLAWRPGLMKIPATEVTSDFNPEDTWTNPVYPWIISEEHAGVEEDKTFFAAADYFTKLNAKALVSTAVKAHSSKHGSDPAHYGQPLHNKIMRVLALNLYPYTAVLNPHGMVPHSKMELLLVNNYNTQVPTDGTKSLLMLTGLSLAQQRFDSAVSKSTVRFRSISLATTLPGTIDYKGKPTRLTARNNSNSVFRTPKRAHHDNVIGNMLHTETKVVSRQGRRVKVKVNSGRSMHLAESVNKYLQGQSGRRSTLIQALQRVGDWWVQYEPEIHNPWKLRETHPQVYANMRSYSQFFMNLREQASNDIDENSEVLEIETYLAKRAKVEINELDEDARENALAAIYAVDDMAHELKDEYDTDKDGLSDNDQEVDAEDQIEDNFITLLQFSKGYRESRTLRAYVGEEPEPDVGEEAESSVRLALPG